MYAKILFINNTSDWQSIERVHEHFEDLLSVLFAAFLFEVVQLCHDSWLVISPQHDHGFGWGYFHQHEHTHHFDRHDSTVNVVSQKDESGLALGWAFGKVDSSFRGDFLLWKKCKNFDKIEKLSMDITNDDNRVTNSDDIGFLF